VDEYQNHNHKTGNESLGRYKIITQKKKLKTWDDEIKLIVRQKNFT